MSIPCSTHQGQPHSCLVLPLPLHGIGPHRCLQCYCCHHAVLHASQPLSRSHRAAKPRSEWPSPLVQHGWPRGQRAAGHHQQPAVSSHRKQQPHHASRCRRPGSRDRASRPPAPCPPGNEPEPSARPPVLLLHCRACQAARHGGKKRAACVRMRLCGGLDGHVRPLKRRERHGGDRAHVVLQVYNATPVGWLAGWPAVGRCDNIRGRLDTTPWAGRGENTRTRDGLVFLPRPASRVDENDSNSFFTAIRGRS